MAGMRTTENAIAVGHVPERYPLDLASAPASLPAKLARKAEILMSAIENLQDGSAIQGASAGGEGRGAFGAAFLDLTCRELEVLSLMAQGYTNSGIAERLVIQRKTVENHINRIYDALHLAEDNNVFQRVQAVLLYIDYVFRRGFHNYGVTWEAGCVGSTRGNSSNQPAYQPAPLAELALCAPAFSRSGTRKDRG